LPSPLLLLLLVESAESEESADELPEPSSVLEPQPTNVVATIAMHIIAHTIFFLMSRPPFFDVIFLLHWNRFRYCFR
jgi:hypothetical protein